MGGEGSFIRNLFVIVETEEKIIYSYGLERDKKGLDAPLQINEMSSEQNLEVAMYHVYLLVGEILEFMSSNTLVAASEM